MPATDKAVYTQAQTEAFMDDTNLNPVSTEDRGEVNITLTFYDVDINPGLIFNALQGLGVVQSDFLPTRKNYNFIIS